MVPSPTWAEIGRSAALFFVTTLSVFLVHVLSWTEGGFSDPAAVKDSAVFAGCLMGILLAHEMGHYLMARLNGFEQSLPVFIPMPFGFGTLGAIIRLKSPPRSRDALLRMGAAGPIAGAVVAFLVLIWALPFTKEDVQLPAGATVTIFNDPWIVRILGTLVNGAPPGRYAEYHPAALAAWVGCFLTGVNLLPTGQLDGGHVLNALFPRFADRYSRWLPIGLLTAGSIGLGWSLLHGEMAPAPVSWLVWGGVIRFVGADRPIPVPLTPLSRSSLVVGALTLGLFLLTFMPVPMEVETLPPALAVPAPPQ